MSDLFKSPTKLNYTLSYEAKQYSLSELTSICHNFAEITFRKLVGGLIFDKEWTLPAGSQKCYALHQNNPQYIDLDGIPYRAAWSKAIDSGIILKCRTFDNYAYIFEWNFSSRQDYLFILEKEYRTCQP